MNKKWVLASSVLAFALIHASGQTSGGGGGTSGGGASGGATTSSGSSGQGSTTVNPQTGVQNPQNPQNPQQVPPPVQLPPGLQNRRQLPPGQQPQPFPPGVQPNQFKGGVTNQAFSTNQNTSTNDFAGRTNRFGDTNLFPTGRNFTNQFHGTNGFDPKHFDRSRFRDEAVTPADQSLLIRIKQTITTEISVSTSGGGSFVPIHIAIRNGQVTLIGLVANSEQAQRIQAMVAQMPGVVGVQNGLSTLPPDQAATENDRVILAQIRQVIPQTAGAWEPVSFDVRQGTVGIVGIVPTTQESQRIATVVQQVPGVVRTSNTLIVDASVRTGATPM
jgi:osmotically-inducible protein OsmY